MRTFSEECGAENPQSLRGTTLRKHIATMSTNFNLQDEQVSDLANFMGHADKIHRSHYKQPLLSREILHVSKVLEAVQGRNNYESDENEGDIEETSETQESEQDPIVIYQSNSFEGNVCNNISSTSMKGNESNSKNPRKRSTSPFGKCTRVRWTASEKEVIMTAFKEHFSNKTLPSLAEIQKLKLAHPGVLNRNSATIKTWMHNQHRSANKK
ncbi:uncharacterized protein LOC105702821 [Orussus abietinus]|uniref:uncharacterized protein LOC105702821 n=1 Tax=Orussus abietinus TaxID=222816 RepID=UPI000C715B2F|nr:uncharacterized protein LOC105702821 [Orussus abietinus]